MQFGWIAPENMAGDAQIASSEPLSCRWNAHSLECIPRPPKRKYDSVSYIGIEANTCMDLIEMCHLGVWNEVIRRCEASPHECLPVLWNAHDKQQLNCTTGDIFHETALGIACESAELGSDTMKHVIKALLCASPSQVRASQKYRGHTPLRSAILNRRCTPVVLELLLEATLQEEEQDDDSVVLIEDRNGLCLVDHLVMGLQLGTTASSLDLFKVFFLKLEEHNVTPQFKKSVLLQVLSFCSIVERNPNIAEPDASEDLRLTRLVDAVKFLLQVAPSMVHDRLVLTGCTPLHVVLRYCGSHLPLMRTLLSTEGSAGMLTSRNKYGDFPLHVACSAKVSISALQIIVEHTIARRGSPTIPGVNTYVWSANSVGLSPIDLLWIRRVDGGDRPGNERLLYPMEPWGVRRGCFKHDLYYEELLRETVDYIVGTDHSSVVTCKKRKEHAFHTLGSFLSCASLLISAATQSVVTELTSTFLHSLCVLVSSEGPKICLALLKLFLWIYRDDLLHRDANGMIPLHHAMACNGLESTTKTEIWKDFVIAMLDAEPMAAQVRTSAGQLPIHILLDNNVTKFKAPMKDTLEGAKQDIVKKLVTLYPEATDCRDPRNNLAPFMIAATDQYSSLESIYLLLRHSPARCSVQDA